VGKKKAKKKEREQKMHKLRRNLVIRGGTYLRQYLKDSYSRGVRGKGKGRIREICVAVSKGLGEMATAIVAW